jgi:acetyltransferase-like isoleucine patch superfamily enzyme
MNKTFDLFIWFVASLFLKMLPLIRFAEINRILFSLMGNCVGRGSRIYSSVRIFRGIEVKIGCSTFIGHETIITGGKCSITIGDRCDISDRVSFVGGTHEIDIDGPRAAGRGIGKDIKVGNGVWIGYGSIILPGVTIGDNAIIGAGCVVSKDVATRSVVVSQSQRVIRSMV